jgi:hypothetical protein
VSFVRGSIEIGPGLKVLSCFPTLGWKKVLEEDSVPVLEEICPVGGATKAEAVEVVLAEDNSEEAVAIVAVLLTAGSEATDVVIFRTTGVVSIISDVIGPFFIVDE